MSCSDAVKDQTVSVAADKSHLQILILGAGHAGGSVAAQLRQAGHRGLITLIGEEPMPPYQRPALSKAYLKGELSEERLLLRPATFYPQHGITLRTGTRAVAIDRVLRKVSLEDGSTLPYDRLVLATGASPRRLEASIGGTLDGVQTLRTTADVERLKVRVKPGARALILGAGYIGLEVAAVLRELGMSVTVLEAQERVLARVAGPEVSRFYQELHRGHGVDLRLKTGLVQLTGEQGKVALAELSDGQQLAIDLVLVGIGVTPCDSLAREAGIACENGVLVDEDARTCDPNIYAIGDCSVRPLLHYGRTGRLESVHNALEQARLAAHHLMGLDRPHGEVPWFWSDQYGLKLQTAGLSAGYDQTLVRGDLTGGKFAVYYLSGRRLLAVDAVNAMADFMFGKRLAGSQAELSLDALRDPALDLKTFQG